MSAATGFSPKRSPRPEYPPATFAIKSFLVSTTRGTFITAVLTVLIAPYFYSTVSFLGAAGLSERVIFTLLASAAHTVVYVLVNLLFFELLCTKLGWFRKYRLARKQYQVPSASLMNQTLSEASIGQLAISPFLLYLSFPLLEQLGVPACDSELPSVAVLWWQFGVAHLFNDVFFYWSHRIVHVTAIYPLIHKKHHTYTGTIGMAAEYAHPIEQLLANTFPTVGGVLLFGRHPLVLVMWLGQRLQQTYESHSGYCFYGSWVHGIGLTNSHSTAWHDYHHTGNQGNFGAAWLDWLCGTMDHFCELGMAEGYIEHCRRQASKSG